LPGDRRDRARSSKQGRLFQPIRRGCRQIPRDELTMDRGCLAVVFDLFGTLVPAYPHHAVLTEMAAVLGMDMDRLSFIAAFVEDTRNRRSRAALVVAKS